MSSAVPQRGGGKLGTFGTAVPSKGARGGQGREQGKGCFGDVAMPNCFVGLEPQTTERKA